MKCERESYKKKIKTMNIKMAITTYLPTNLKNKLSRQQEQRQNYQHGEPFDGCLMGGGMGEKVRRLRSANSYKITMGM